MMNLPPDPPLKLLVALLTEDGYMPRFIRRRLHLPTPIDTHDRLILEQVIFPGTSPIRASDGCCLSVVKTTPPITSGSSSHPMIIGRSSPTQKCAATDRSNA